MAYARGRRADDQHRRRPARLGPLALGGRLARRGGRSCTAAGQRRTRGAAAPGSGRPGVQRTRPAGAPRAEPGWRAEPGIGCRLRADGGRRRCPVHRAVRHGAVRGRGPGRPAGRVRGPGDRRRWPSSQLCGVGRPEGAGPVAGRGAVGLAGGFPADHRLRDPVSRRPRPTALCGGLDHRHGRRPGAHPGRHGHGRAFHGRELHLVAPGRPDHGPGN